MEGFQCLGVARERGAFCGEQRLGFSDLSKKRDASAILVYNTCQLWAFAGIRDLWTLIQYAFQLEGWNESFRRLWLVHS